MLNSYYFVSDYDLNKIFILNESWSYVSSKTFSSPAYLTTIGNSLYATGDSNIWKLDQNLNILIQYNAAPAYRGIYYNSTNGLIYTAAFDRNMIHIFNLNLSFHHFISTPYEPWSEYNYQIYVGTLQSQILVIENEVIINTFFVCNSWSLVSYILFDQCGLMATSCYYILSLKRPNGAFINYLNIPSQPRYIGFDSNGQFVQISAYQIRIYI